MVRHGVEPAFFRLDEHAPADRPPFPQPYILSVSTIHPHKNWERWLEAYRRLAAEGIPHHLVIAGLKGKYSEELLRLIDSQGLAGRVHATGWVPRAELLSLFKFADALVFPSTFEGFGLPVLEAMAAGIPVACSDIPPLREAAGDAVLYFDPYSADSIAATVRQLLSDAALRARLVDEARQNAARLTWREAADMTLAVLRRAAG